MVRGIGVDVIRIGRFRGAVERWRGRFLDRLFSEREVEECRRWKDPVTHLAVKFAAKEAFSKAVGTGFGAALSPRDLQVLHDDKGAPRLVVSGRAEARMRALGMEKVFLSLSHDGDVGVAFVVLEGLEGRA